MGAKTGEGQIMFVKGYKAVSGKNHYMWIGDKISYHSLHTWVRNNFGRPLLCEICKTAGGSSRKYNWANITGALSRERAAWKRLCSKCHYQFDIEKHKVTRTFKYSRTAICPTCELEFKKHPDHTGRQKYCSRKCGFNRNKKHKE